MPEASVAAAAVEGGTRLPRLRGPGGRPVRVLHVATVDMSLALLLGTELRAVADAGLEVHAASAPGPYTGAVEAAGATFHALPSFTRSWSLRDDARAVAELVRLVRRLRPDVLHLHTPKPGVLGRVVGRATGVPVVVNTCHGLWVRPGQRRWLRAAVLAVEGAAARCSHVELYQNAEDASSLRRWARGRQRVVGNGIDLQRFRPDPEARARKRREWGVPDDVVLVGGVGRLVAEKGVLDLAAAAALLPPGCEVVWVGPRDEDKPDSLGEVPAPVRWLGPSEDVVGVYNALDVFVLPSYREGFSRSAMEAAACGTALVLSDIRGCRELGTHGEDLLLVPTAEPARLAAAVSRLVLDVAERDRLAESARQRALREYDQVRVARASMTAYADVARRRSLGWDGWSEA